MKSYKVVCQSVFVLVVLLSSLQLFVKCIEIPELPSDVKSAAESKWSDLNSNINFVPYLPMPYLSGTWDKGSILHSQSNIVIVTVGDDVMFGYLFLVGTADWRITYKQPSGLFISGTVTSNTRIAFSNGVWTRDNPAPSVVKTEVMGERFSDNFNSLISSFDQVVQICLGPGYVTKNVGAISWKTTSGKLEKIGVSRTTSCLNLDPKDLIRYYEIRGARIITRVMLVTVSNKVLLYGDSTFETMKEDGRVINAAISGFSYRGKQFGGVFGNVYSSLSTSSDLTSLGFNLFNFQNEPIYTTEYPQPVGDFSQGLNFDYELREDEEKVKEICCRSSDLGVTYVYIRTERNAVGYGSGKLNQKCLVLDGQPLKWKAISTVALGGKVGQLTITRLDGKTVTCKSTANPTGSVYENTEFKFLRGFIGFAGPQELTLLGPVWAKNIKSISLLAYRYTSDDSIVPQNPTAITSQRLINRSSRAQQTQITGTYSVTSETVITSEATKGQKTTVENVHQASASIKKEFNAFIVKASSTTTYTFTESNSDTRSFSRTWAEGLTTSKTETVSYSVPIVVPPGSSITANVVYSESIRNLNWEALVRISYADGTEEVDTISGVFKDNKYRQIIASVEQDHFDQTSNALFVSPARGLSQGYSYRLLV